MTKKIKVLFVASEMAPLAKVGGLGDVIGSLPKALKKIGVDAEAVIPRYEHISKKNLKFFYRLDKHTAVFKTKSRGVNVYLIDNKKYLSRGPIYFNRTAFAGTKKEIERFNFFSKAAFELIRQGILKPDIVQANDWHTGALVKALKSNSQTPKVIFTIHNLANQGVWRGKNLMAEGIKNADFVTTVSPTYSKEILTKSRGDSLDALLNKRAAEKKLAGILNGIDYGFWRAETRRKILFQKKLGLKSGSKIPIFGLVARLTSQKGIGFIAPILQKFIKKFGAEFVFLGKGETQYETRLKTFGKSCPKNIFAKIGFDEKLAHKIYAQADFFLMPSSFEPSGLGQMIAMRYGTIPIVRATGGLKDTVIHKKTGFVFHKQSSKGLERAMNTALDYYFKRPLLFKKIMSNCKKQDFSWRKSALKYRALYAKVSK